MIEPRKTTTAVWVLFLLFCIIWLSTLGARTLVPSDEGRYAEMAREMALTGDWITPRLNGIKYFEKPPLQTWMNALTFRAFGLGEWQARLWTGLCGLFGIFMTAHAGRRLFGARTGFNAGVVLASSFLWAALGHFNALDMGLSAMMALALCALLLAQRNDATAREQRNWMLACWAGMALAVMSKGLVGVVLPGAVLVLYTLLARDWRLWKRLHFGAGLALFLAITAPWFILVSLKNPEFPHFFFIHEHFQRFVSKVHHREGAWHYFIPVLLLGSIPWLGLLLQSLWAGRRDAESGFQPKKMLLIWIAFIFFFFSISSSKLPSYILPVFPALALLIACQLERASTRTLMINAGMMALAGAVGLALSPRIPALGAGAYEHALFRAYQPWAVAAAVLALTGGSLAAVLARRYRQLSIVSLGMTGFLASQLMMLGHEPLGRDKAGLNQVPAIAAELTPDTLIYAVKTYEHALPFYLRHTLMLVEQPDEMAFGLQQEPQRWLPTYEAFVDAWKAQHAAGKKAIAILRPDVLADMKKQNLPFRIIAQDPRRIIVTNDTGSKPAS
jgi:4-amino-4-deoxy-L-arabinose transferase-like glycosyltransferase